MVRTRVEEVQAQRRASAPRPQFVTNLYPSDATVYGSDSPMSSSGQNRKGFAANQHADRWQGRCQAGALAAKAFLLMAAVQITD